MIDETDELILQELQKNGRITMKDLGEKVHLTGQAASDRVTRLEEKEIIEGYTAKVNLKSINHNVAVFITLIIKASNHQPLLEFIESQKNIYIEHLE